jgi:hypothetical protein
VGVTRLGGTHALDKVLCSLIAASTAIGLVGCSTTRLRAPSAVPSDEITWQREERIVAVTTVEGEKIVFDQGKEVRVRSEMIHGPVMGVTHNILLENVSRIWVVETGTGHVVPRSPWRERIIGVSTLDGRQVVFDRNPVAYVRGDTVFAYVRGSRYRIALSDVSIVSTSRFDPVKTSVITIGLVAMTVFILFVIQANSLSGLGR